MCWRGVPRILGGLLFLHLLFLHLGFFPGLEGPTPVGAQAILNVERLSSGTSEGRHHAVNGRLSLARGNTDIFQLGLNLGLGFRGTTHWVRVLSGLEYLDQSNKRLLDNRYLHLRYNRFFSERVRSFHFLQIQTNRNLLLESRSLVGSGLRGSVFKKDRGFLDVGLGAMYEVEDLRRSALTEGEPARTRTTRLSNLVVGSWVPGERSRLTAVVYHQPALGAFSDYRLLGEMSLAVSLSIRAELEVSLDWRHDSRAPGSLNQDDVGLKTGFTYRTR